MKNALLILTLTIFTASVSSAASNQVLLKSRTGVGFAPPDMTGIYTTQIEADGTVRHIDNKNRQRAVAKLSIVSITELKKKIAALKAGELIRPDRPECMDAPTTTVSVIKENGQEIVISQEMGCIVSRLENDQYLGLIAEGVENLTTYLRPSK